MPLCADGIFVLNLVRMGGWLAVFGLMVTIYFLYMKYTKGIYLAKIAATSAMVAYFATYYWRHDTVDYGLQGVIGLFLVVMLFLPVIEMVLMGEDSS